MNMPDWVIIESKSGAEEVAERTLRQAGYRVYLPRFRKILTPHGRARRTMTAMRPVFARFLFVHDWRGWPPTPLLGVSGMIYIRPGKPAKLSDPDVRLIEDRERSGFFDEVPHAGGSGQIVRSDIEPGEEVAFDAFGERVMGLLEELTDDGKAIVSAFLLGGQVRTTVRADKIQKANVG